MLGQKCSEEIRIINIIHTKDSVQNEEQTQDGIPEKQESHFYWWGKRDVKKKKGGILIGTTSLLQRLSVRV